MTGSHYFWLGASADADPATQATPGAAKASPPSGECPLRYEVGEVSYAQAAVFDMARNGECFCLIDPGDCVGGLPTALARAQDIADMFNEARA